MTNRKTSLQVIMSPKEDVNPRITQHRTTAHIKNARQSSHIPQTTNKLGTPQKKCQPKARQFQSVNPKLAAVITNRVQPKENNNGNKNCAKLLSRPQIKGSKTIAPADGSSASDPVVVSIKAKLQNERIDLQQQEMSIRLEQLQQMCDRLKTDCQQKQDRISELETAVAVKTGMIKEREDDIDKLKHTVENFRLTSISRDSIVREELHELDQRIADLEAKLTKKCTKSSIKNRCLTSRIDELQTKLVQAGMTIEQQNKKLIEILKTERKEIQIE